jgi:hypothetical protein
VFVKIDKNYVLWPFHYLPGRSPSSTVGRHGFNTRSVYVVFVADGGELGESFLEQFSLSVISHKSVKVTCK